MAKSQTQNGGNPGSPATPNPATAEATHGVKADAGGAGKGVQCSPYPELAALGLVPRSVKLEFRQDGSISPFTPYQAFDSAGMKSLLRLAKTRKASSERFMGTDGLAIRHGMKVQYTWADESGEEHAGDAYVLWSDGIEAEVIKSPSAVRDIDQILKLFGVFPWPEPLRLRIVKEKTRSGYYAFNVELV